MSQIALIKDTLVINVIEADLPFGQKVALAQEAFALDVTEVVPRPSVGWAYTDGEFSAPPVPEPQPAETLTWANAPDEYFWINTGPFKDRFGDDWPVIASSTDRECVAFKEAAIEGRQYINLKDPRIAGALDMMIATSKPTNWAMFPASGPITPAKKAAILNLQTTDYERHIKGLPQPTA